VEGLTAAFNSRVHLSWTHAQYALTRLSTSYMHKKKSLGLKPGDIGG